MVLKIWLFSLIIFIDARTIDIRHDLLICSTRECKDFGRRIITSMNASVDPCVDFYEYACGNWPRTRTLPPDENSWQMRAASDEENKRKVEEMLKLELRGDEIPSVKVAKQWYKTCMDTGSKISFRWLLEDANKRGMEPLVSTLDKIGGWPMIMERNEWNESGQKWQNIDDYYAHLRGLNLLHDIRVTVYGKGSKEKSVMLDVPDMPLYSWTLREYFDAENETINKQDFRKAEKYWDWISKIVSRISETGGFNITKSQLEEDIEDIFSFEWKLLKISSLVDDYVNMTVGDFQRWYDHLNPRTENSKVNWTDKIINIFKETGIDISNDTLVKITSPGYFKNLVPLLDETSTRTIVNFLHWSFVSSMITRTTDEMRELNAKMVESDPDEQESRSDLCIKEGKITEVIAYEFVRRYFSNDMIDMTMNALNDIEEEMKVDIEESNWASEEIKGFALRKIKSIKKNIGYPDWYNNASIVGNYFGDLTMGPTYFENALRFQKFYKLKELRLLKYKDLAKSWIIDPLTINAFYLSESNSITVPLANLQKPFFSKNQPNTINYALTGFLLAHELYHSFDELKRFFNEHGKKINWPKTMTNEYYKSAQCFIDQYNNYTLNGTSSGIKIKNYGNQTFDENMPDTMGLRTAYKAYKRRERINGKSEAALPGLEMFSNDQIFFLSSANLWCENRDSETEITEAKLDVHSIARLRSIGALSNNQDFANAFSCPIGSPMNREKKCNIWKI